MEKVYYRIDTFCPACDDYMITSEKEKTLYCVNYKCKKFGKRYKMPVFNLEEIINDKEQSNSTAGD